MSAESFEEDDNPAEEAAESNAPGSCAGLVDSVELENRGLRRKGFLRSQGDREGEEDVFDATDKEDEEGRWGA